LKQDELKDLNEHINKLTEKNLTLTQRLQRLRETNENNMSKACNDYRNYTKQPDSRSFVEKDDLLSQITQQKREQEQQLKSKFKQRGLLLLFLLLLLFISSKYSRLFRYAKANQKSR
jgi:hypothetical protein